MLLARLNRTFPRQHQRRRRQRILTRHTTSHLHNITKRDSRPTVPHRYLTPIVTQIIIPILNKSQIGLPNGRTSRQTLRIVQNFIQQHRTRRRTIFTNDRILLMGHVGLYSTKRRIRPPRTFRRQTVNLRRRMVAMFKAPRALTSKTIISIQMGGRIRNVPQ